MKYQDILPTLTEILQTATGNFLTAYQICQRIESINPELWNSLVNEYPSSNSEIPTGHGTGRQYSPASFVANALSYFNSNNTIIGLRQEMFECEGVLFNGIKPGFTGNVIGIWAITI